MFGYRDLFSYAKRIFLSQTEEPVNQAKDSRDPGSVASLQASEGSSPFTFPFAWIVMFAMGPLRTAWADMKKERDHCDYECCKNKTSP